VSTWRIQQQAATCRTGNESDTDGGLVSATASLLVQVSHNEESNFCDEANSRQRRGVSRARTHYHGNSNIELIRFGARCNLWNIVSQLPPNGADWIRSRPPRWVAPRRSELVVGLSIKRSRVWLPVARRHRASCSRPCAPVTQQHNLVPVNGRRHLRVGR